jgi:hypothetical protein
LKYIWFVIIPILLLIPIIIHTESQALQQIAGPIIIEIKPGESKTFQWGLASDSDALTTIELRSEGKGSEFLSFTKKITIEPRQFAYAEFTVTIPDDHPGGVELTPSLYATEFGEQGGSTVINIQMKKIPTIKVTPNENPEFRSNTAYDEKIEQDIQTGQELQVTPKSTEQTNEKTTIINPALQEPKCGQGTHLENGLCVPDKQEKGGGCLIATAAFGSELASHVQMLRETRDNVVLHTQSGAAFMTAFNSMYYSFAPTVADLERENQVFKEIVKTAITPLITTLSILNYVDVDSEAEMIGYGISIIILNVGMYIVGPTIVIMKLKNKVKKSDG